MKHNFLIALHYLGLYISLKLDISQVEKTFATFCGGVDVCCLSGIQYLNEMLILLFVREVRLYNFECLGIDVMILMLLELLEIVKAPFLLHKDSEVVFTILILEMLFSTSKGVLETFKSNCEHANILHFQDGAESFDQSFRDKSIELLWICRSSAVAQSPDSLILDSNVVMLQDLDKLVNDANVDTVLQLFFSASCDV